MMKKIGLFLVTLVPAAAPAAAQIMEYYHLDAIGNVRAVTDQAGTVIERHDYLPFGEEYNPQPGTQPKRFTGKERDVETGFDYFGARYYGSKIGRFTTVDPGMAIKDNLVNPQKWNRYAYVSNNPLRFVDPDGREQTVIMGGRTYMGGVDGLPAGSQSAQNLVFGILAAGTGGIALGMASPALLTAGSIALGKCGVTPACQNAVRGLAESATGAPPGSMGTLPFQPGEVITRQFKTAKGVVEMAAEAVVEGKSLHLKDLAVFPRGAERLEVGAAEVLAMRRQLADEARALGFEELRVTGTRISGANPGKAVDVTIDLTKKQ